MSNSQPTNRVHTRSAIKPEIKKKNKNKKQTCLAKPICSMSVSSTCVTVVWFVAKANCQTTEKAKAQPLRDLLKVPQLTGDLGF